MKRHFAVPILIALLALAAPATSRAETAKGEPRAEMKRGMRGRPGMMEGLKLSDDQKSKLEEVHYRHEKKAIEMRADLRLATLDLHRLMRAESPDQRAIDAQIDRVSALRGSLQKAGVASMLETRALLTPEQRKLWREQHGRGGMRRGGMMHGGPGGGMMHDGPHGGMHDQMGEEHEGDAS
jgi:Spy/CpxP family protein refolding chaperone